MSEHSENAGFDQPEPEEALSGSVERTPDHDPTDMDDRDVPLDDPDRPDPPVDEDDRDTDAPEPG
jgi:hypothetical protein